MKFFRRNNYTEKAKIQYFLNLVYFLRLVGLWQNRVLYWPLTGLMWRNRMPFGKRVVNKYGSVCYYYRSFFHGTLQMWARKKCLLFKHEKNNQTLSNDWPTYCQTRIYLPHAVRVLPKITKTTKYEKISLLWFYLSKLR